ncbi:PREDICTED: uncharacterized protein LOC106811627 [Priapulus caudatus]|uniref:Uncharacterized protein LOC106811627 n=1 Tax=Priapulus caudatus TaxID=37621 RepID=A0ABM1EF43_PRICU|nr:PREDICTED: uncharacterized protein LOC106811627 [Priapulus caudatus]
MPMALSAARSCLQPISMQPHLSNSRASKQRNKKFTMSGNTCSLYSKLKQLECPFIESSDEAFINDLVFSPGESRIHVLQWLLIRFDSSLELHLEEAKLSAYSKEDPRILRLLLVVSSLGLCEDNDVELIKGGKPDRKQTALMDRLIRLAFTTERFVVGDEHSDSEPYNDSVPTLQQHFGRCCHMMDEILQNVDVKELFSHTASLHPPHTEKYLNSQVKKGLISKKPPDVAKLVDMSRELSETIEKETRNLEELKARNTCTEYDETCMDTLGTRMRLLLTDLKQLATNFTCCYETQLKQWCGNTEVEMSPLALPMKCTYDLLRSFADMLVTVGSIHGSYANCLTTREKLKALLNEGTSGRGSVREESLRLVRECVAILEEAVQTDTRAWKPRIRLPADESVTVNMTRVGNNTAAEVRSRPSLFNLDESLPERKSLLFELAESSFHC